MRYDDILGTVGRTPVVRLNNVEDTACRRPSG